MNWKSIAIRAASGIVYIALIVTAIFLHIPGLSFLAALFACLAVFELEKNVFNGFESSARLLLTTLDALATVCLTLAWFLPITLIFWALMIFCRFILQIFVIDGSPLLDISILTLTQFYIGLPLALLVFLLVMVEFNSWLLLSLISLIWINDTGAYLVGCTFGKHRLYERLSPKKSWEGFFGGLIFSMGAAVGYYFCFDGHLSSYLLRMGFNNVIFWIGCGIIVSVLSTVGDLFESMIKRELGVKDSGNLIPGHGGILDRIDSLLFVAPGLVVLFCFAMTNMGEYYHAY